MMLKVWKLRSLHVQKNEGQYFAEYCRITVNFLVHNKQSEEAAKLHGYEAISKRALKPLDVILEQYLPTTS